MELRNVTTFLRIVELKQFSKAADELGYAQSTVTTQIQQLEEELQHPLFDRLHFKNTVTLTEFGRAFLPLAQNMYNTSLEMKALASPDAEIKGTLRIGVVESIFYSDFLFLLPGFQSQFPRVSLEFSTGSSEQVQRMLLQNKVDLICCLAPSSLNPKVHIDFSKVCNVMFVTNQKNKLSSDHVYSLKEISEQLLIITEGDSVYNKDLHRLLYEKNLDMNQCICLQSTNAIINLLKIMNGVSYLPDYVAQKEIMKGNLRPLRVDVPETRITVIVAYHKDKWVSPQMRGLMDILRKQRFL